MAELKSNEVLAKMNWFKNGIAKYSSNEYGVGYQTTFMCNIDLKTGGTQSSGGGGQITYSNEYTFKSELPIYGIEVANLTNGLIVCTPEPTEDPLIWKVSFTWTTANVFLTILFKIRIQMPVIQLANKVLITGVVSDGITVMQTKNSCSWYNYEQDIAFVSLTNNQQESIGKINNQLIFIPLNQFFGTSTTDIDKSTVYLYFPKIQYDFLVY